MLDEDETPDIGLSGTTSSHHVGREFADSDLALDDNTFIDCRFTRCKLIYRGTGVATLRGCRYVECEWVFVAQTRQTAQFWPSHRRGYAARARHWATVHVGYPSLEAIEFLYLVALDVVQFFLVALVWQYGLAAVNTWAPDGSKSMVVLLLKAILTVGLAATVGLAIVRNIRRGYAGPLTIRGRRRNE